MHIKDGGPAFPIPEQRAFDGAGLVEGHDGMTLRDWFAGQALAGICAGLSADGAEDTPRASFRFTFTHAAQDAYHIADAMLERRASQAGE